MNIPPNDFIHLETHDYIDQFIYIEKGNGLALINNKEYLLSDNISIVIPAKTQHKIINTSNTENLLLYTIYAPPNHKINIKNNTNPDIENITDVKNKYLKYKNKYIELKKSIFNNK